MSTVTILQGDCRQILKTLPAQSVQCCVTSPPYWGLRDYGHADQIGQEPTPEAFIEDLVAVFREVRRVLADNGTLWLNLGDSYNSGASGGLGGSTISGGQANQARSNRSGRKRLDGLKPKDLIGIPWRTALALQADGWWLRQDIIWAKPNPMPESVTDRCTKSHEYIFLLSKSEKYYFDAEAIREPCAESQRGRIRADKFGGNKGDVVNHSPGSIYVKGRGGKNAFRGQGHFREGENGPANRDGRDMKDVGAGDTRNKRDVWTVATKPYHEAHFATFPPALILPCVLAGCAAGGTVLDPFAGSGTTGKVALEAGRCATLIELTLEYIPLCEQRTKTNPPVQESEDGA